MKKMIEEKNSVKKVKNQRKVILINHYARIVFILVGFLLCFLAIFIKLTYTMFVDGKRLRKLAYNQQYVNKIISPARGSIFDRNGEILARSVQLDTITMNPKLVKDYKNKNIDEKDFALNIGKILGVSAKEIEEKLKSKKNIVTLKKYVESEKVKEVKKYLETKKITAGINFDADNKRYYPYNTLAAQLLGFCGTDGNGLEGVEKMFDSELTGKEGKIGTVADLEGKRTSEIPTQVIKEENGKNLYLTLDVKMQNTAERLIEKRVKETEADSGIVIIMNPKTGEIYSIANYPSYNNNLPFAPIGMSKEKWDKLDGKAQVERLQNAWRNKAVSDGYEPGSVFKLITAAIGLEENLTVPDKKGDFLCTGSQKVADYEIRCWSYKKPHGSLTLREAVAGSCNPSFIQLGRRIGKDVFKRYLEAFGFYSYTDIEVLGEGSGYFFDDNHFGEVELATLSFGQRFTITPIQMITALAPLSNGGKLVKPTILKKIENPENKTVENNETKEIRNIITKKNSKIINEMLKNTVENGTGVKAYIKGFDIGGKTGTSEPSPSNPNAGYVASFYGVAPTKDPIVSMLVIVKNPKKISTEGSVVAAPVAKEIFAEILPNLIQSDATKVVEIKTNEIKKEIVPNVVSKTVAEATAELQKVGLISETGMVSSISKIKVVKQVPDAGKGIEKAGKVYLITEETDERKTVIVPNVVGETVENARRKLKSIGLNPISSNSAGKVIKQSLKANEKVLMGTIIEIDSDK